MKNLLAYKLKDLSYLLPNKNKLFSIKSLTINHGEHVLIKGESGSGKSTFLHLLSGLSSQYSGSINLGEVELKDLSDDQMCELRRKNLAIIFQKLNLMDHLTVQENILLIKKEKSFSKLNEILKHLAIAELKDIYSSRLSTGQQQRVAIARALYQDASIILADEPTSSLDLKNTTNVMKILKENAKNKTLIVVSHDDRIFSYFDRIIDFGDYK